MPRMLTEEEVQRLEQQRALRDRAQKAGSTAGMSWNERKRFEEAQERQMWDQRFRETHGGLSSAEVAAAGPNGSGRQYGAIKRGFELQAARENEMDRLGKELATREEEARQKRYGMAEQGMEAAKLRYGYTGYDDKYHPGGETELAKIQAANAEKIAGINAANAEKIAGINAASTEKISTDRNKSNEELAQINKEATVETAGINARAQAAQQYAQELMKQRVVDQKQALEFAETRARLIAQMEKTYTNKLGKLTINGKFGDEARAIIEKMVEERLKSQLPGKARNFVQ